MENGSFNIMENCTGELSLLDFVEKLRFDSSPEPLSSPRNSTALVAIQLEDERKRRQECEKLIQHLQGQISKLQQDNAVAATTVKRKDALLLQAQQQFEKSVDELKKQNKAVLDENKLLFQKAEEAEKKLKDSLDEASSLSNSLNAAKDELERSGKSYSEVSQKLDFAKSELEKIEKRYKLEVEQLVSRNTALEEELKNLQTKQLEIVKENHRLKNSLEDLSRQKELLETECELAEERNSNERLQWEEHCRLKIKETARLAEDNCERRLKSWQDEVEGKLKHLVSTLEQQLEVLKQKNIEEIQLLEARHKEALQVSELRCLRLQQKLQQQQKEQHEAAAKMKQLLEAQWVTMSRIGTTAGTGSHGTSPPAASDEDSASHWSSSSVPDTQRRAEMQRYVNTILKEKQVKSTSTKKSK